MKNKKNGFTTIELITTFALTLVIVVLLLQVIVVLKDVYINKVVVNSLRVKQAVMTEKIMDDFDNKNLEGTAGCVGVSNCISFIWEDGTVTELKIDKTKNTFSYADYVTELTGGSSFGNLSVVDSAVSEDKQRKFISFNFPIYSTFVKGDYGIHVIYQYNPTKTGINASSFGNTTDGPSLFVLNGDNPVLLDDKTTYNESTMGGYKAFYNNAWNTSPTVTIKYYDINDKEVSGIQKKALTIIRYSYTAPDGKLYTQDRKIIFKTYQYDYTGSVQTFVVPTSGYYKFQAWGAQGGTYSSYAGGKGAYTRGVIYLEAKTTLYLYVGQSSNSTTATFNGGGAGGAGTDGHYTSGGGATDIRLKGGNWYDSVSLASRIMVAAGGAGSGFYYTGPIYGGAGGTLIGFSGTGAGTGTPHTLSTGGTQISAGVSASGGNAGSFGVGATSSGTYSTGGGGGYYGGGSGGVSNTYVSSGAGGSSYISGDIGCVAIKSETDITPKIGCTSGTTDINCSIHYSGQKFINTTMIDGTETMPAHENDNSGTSVGNSGNGFIRIEYIGVTNEIKNTPEGVYYSYKGAPELFIAPNTGYYELQLWGAQGGSSYSSYIGGYGGFSVGRVYLTSGQQIYVYVGGVGSSGCNYNYCSGGYNGGGRGSGGNNPVYSGGGGGATSITNKLGLISNLSSSTSSILIVAGGGGGSSYQYSNNIAYSGNGGSGGGYLGVSGVTTQTAYNYGSGGSQTSGGIYGDSNRAKSGTFGTGGDGIAYSAGGGGGYYGGGASNQSGAGGGSGYIGNTLLISGSKLTKHMTCYNCSTSTDSSIMTKTTTGASSSPIYDYAKIGNGYAMITYIGTTN